jgi:hypothetical protein
MKKLITLLAILIPFTLFAQNSVRIVPNIADVCENTTISVDVPGNSFHPQTYLWNTGDVTPSIVINQSGTYTCTVTGFAANNFFVRTLTVSKTYTILPRPTINVINGPWVCRFDTAQLSVSQGYSNYTWNNGSTLQTYTSIRNSVYNNPQLDTTTVWYTASISNVCSVNSDTIVIRGVRAPNGVGIFYCGKTNIDPNDSIPAGLVLEFLYPIQYEMEFTQVSAPSNVFTYFPPIGSRKTPANLLTPGELYSVRSRVIINGWTFCWGIPCQVAVSSPNKLGEQVIFPGIIEYESTKTEKIYIISTIEGKIISTHKATKFDQSWLENLTSSVYIVNVVDGKKINSVKINKI